jgi:uncharacterized protein (TIGR02231 family)
MTLSTASPQLGSNIPKLAPHWIAPITWAHRQKNKVVLNGVGNEVTAKASKKRRTSAFLKIAADADSSSEEDGVFRMAEATAVEGAMSTSYIIHGLSTIPSDTGSTHQAHKVMVAVIDLTADLDWIAVPKQQPSAFLRAKIKNTSSYLFLPGRANIFLENNFVAKSRIEVSAVSFIRNGRETYAAAAC